MNNFNLKEIRSDLWNQMSLNELLQQQEILNTRIKNIENLLANSPTSASLNHIHKTLSQAYNVLSNIINSKMQ